MEKIRLSIATTDKLGKPEYQYQYFYRASDVDARVAELEEEIKQRHASEQAVLAELAATDDTNAAYSAELEKENKRLRGIIAKIANGLNTPFPFPETKSEHDDLLIRSAAEAGKALQKIGRILKEDWWTWSDLPKLVKAALREVDGGKNNI